jgi:hypothetical protein
VASFGLSSPTVRFVPKPGLCFAHSGKNLPSETKTHYADPEIQQRFIELRAQGHTYNRIAADLNVSKRTLITWSRKHQFDIENLRAVELEAMREQAIASRQARVDHLAGQLRQVEDELKKRDITELSTSRLFALAESLRRQILRETGDCQFVSPIAEIPSAELHEEIQRWQG